MGNNNSLAEKPFPSTNLAAEVSPLDHESQHLVVSTSDKGRRDKPKLPGQWDGNPHRKVGE
jgi:hypothetical protein